MSLHNSCDDGLSPTHFFLVGAGLSAPTIPLASGMIVHFREKLAALGIDNEIDWQAPASEVYSRAFEAAYPGPHAQHRYLHKCISGKPIPRACQRLAHLLGDGRLGRIVVTPNFDDFIGKACQLLGHEAISCDHADTAGRIDTDREDVVQLVHVHGTHWHYDLANRIEEIRDVASTSEVGIGGMPALLDRLFFRRSPIVIGYSGWEHDVIMTSFRRRLYQGTRQNRLRNHAYWFCYREQDVGSLPEWLIKHEQVRIVTPGTMGNTRPPHPDEELLRGLGVVQQQPAETLDAERVLSDIIRELQIPPPPLFSDPLNFFAAQLQRLDADAKDPLYRVADVAARLSHAALKDKDHQAHLTRQKAALFRALDAQDGETAASIAETFDTACADSMLIECVDAAYDYLSTSNDPSPKAFLRLAQAVPRLCEAIRDPISSRFRLARAQLDLVSGLLANGRIVEAHELAQSVADLLGPLDLPEARIEQLRLQVALAEIKAIGADRQAGLSELSALSLMLEPAAAPNSILLHMRTLVSMAVFYATSPHTVTEALRAINKLKGRCASTPIQAMQQAWLGVALLAVDQLRRCGMVGQALELNEAILNGVPSPVPARIQPVHAYALRTKAAHLVQLPDPAAATKVLDEILRRYSGVEDPIVKESTAIAAVLRATIHMADGTHVEAADLLDDVLLHYGEQPSQNQQIAAILAIALSSRAALYQNAGDAVRANALWVRVALSYSPYDANHVVRHRVAMAYWNIADRLTKVRLYDRAVDWYRRILVMSEKEADSDILLIRAHSIRNIACIENQRENDGEALRNWTVLIEEFSSRLEPQFQEYVLNARMQIGINQIKTGDFLPALSTFKQIFEVTLSHHSSLPFARLGATATRNMAVSFDLLGQPEGSRVSLDLLLMVFRSHAHDAEVAEQLAFAESELGRLAQRGDLPSASKPERPKRIKKTRPSRRKR